MGIPIGSMGGKKKGLVCDDYCRFAYVRQITRSDWKSWIGRFAWGTVRGRVEKGTYGGKGYVEYCKVLRSYCNYGRVYINT